MRKSRRCCIFDILGWCFEDDASWCLHESMGIQRYCSKTLLRFTLRVRHEHAQVWNVPFVELILLLGPWLPFPFHVFVPQLIQTVQKSPSDVRKTTRLYILVCLYVLIGRFHCISNSGPLTIITTWWNYLELSTACQHGHVTLNFVLDFDKTLWCTRRCLSNSGFHTKIVSRTQGQSF